MIDNFAHNTPFTIGVEEEYMLCDPHSGELINCANEIIQSLPDELKPRYSYELIQSEIEINTSVCNDLSSAMDEIIYLRNYTSKLGKKYGFKLGISGTHPTAICKKQKFVDNKAYNWVSEQLNYYAKRNITFANHVHIAVNDAECAIHVANSLRRWIAPLLAISTNSPFFEGELTGLRSSRTFQFGVFPRTNIPILFNSYSDYIEIINKYIDSKTIEMPRQVWWKIRPHVDYGTIEFRICDMQRNLKNVELIIAICQALVHKSVQEYKNGSLIESFNLEFLYDGLWKAARFPFPINMIDPVTLKITTLSDQIDKMFEYAYSSLKHFKTDHVLNTFKDIINNGTEADKQIAIYKSSGFKGLSKYLINDSIFNYN